MRDDTNNIKGTESMSTYDSLLATVTEANPKFALRHTKEPEQQFLKRMLNDLADLSDEQFDAMPQDAQDWFNHAVNEELNKHKEVTAPDGFADGPSADAGPKRTTRPTISKSDTPTEPKADVAELETVADAEAKPRRKRAAKNGDAKPAADVERKAPFGGARGGSRKEFSVRTIRRLVIENPSITVDDLMNRAHDAGEVYSRNTVNLARNQTLEMIEVAKQVGHWQ